MGPWHDEEIAKRKKNKKDTAIITAIQACTCKIEITLYGG